MSRFNFCGGSYSSQSLTADCQRTVNWMPEPIESQVGKTAIAMYPKPGTIPFSSVMAGPYSRGGVFVTPPGNPGGRLFRVSGAYFYELNAAGNIVAGRQFPVANDGLQASFAASVNQILIASGGTAYVFDLVANTFTPVAALANEKISTVGYADGFFFALLLNSQTLQASAPLDATTWPGASVIAEEDWPDIVLAMIVDHREVILFGVNRTEAFYDAGDFPFPYDRVPGGFVEDGIAAPASVVRLDNSVFWWSADERGAGIAKRFQGYLPSRVSNHAIENEIQGYPTIADAISYSFQVNGHGIWRTYFPSANKTWDYDVATQLWSEADFWNTKKGIYEAHRSRDHVFAFGKHLVGDNQSGLLFQMDIPRSNGQGGWNFCDDFDGVTHFPIRRLRRTPVVAQEDEWMTGDKLVIDAEAGIGPEPPLLDGAGNPRDPQGMLRYSDDNGKTYLAEILLSFGQAGNYLARAAAYRLGSWRKGRVFEFTTTDAVPWRIVEGYLYGSNLPPQERLAKKISQQA